MQESPYEVYRCVEKDVWHHICIEFAENNPHKHILRIRKGKTVTSLDFSVGSCWLIYRWSNHNFRMMRIQMKSYGNELRYFLVETGVVLNYQKFNSQYVRGFLPSSHTHKRRKINHTKKDLNNELHLRVIKSGKQVARIKKIPQLSSINFEETFSPIECTSPPLEEKVIKNPTPPSILKNSPLRNSQSQNQNKLTPKKKVSFVFPSMEEELKNADGSSKVTLSSIINRSQEERLPPWLLLWRCCRTPLGKWGFLLLCLGILGVTNLSGFFFYTAASTGIAGAVLLGINLFRAYPKSAQTTIRTSFVPKI